MGSPAAADLTYLQNNVNTLDAQLALSVANTGMTQANKQSLYNTIIANKNSDIQQANDSLLAQTNAMRALYYYQGQDNRLNDVNKSILGTTTEQANALQNDSGLAKRQNEINEWETGDKMDTLFVYQMSLILLCVIVVLSYLWKLAVLGTATFVIFIILLLCVFFFTLANRAQYTSLKRDTRFWHQRQFPNAGPPTNVCAIGEEIAADLSAITDLGGYAQGQMGNMTSGV
jgi:uncharacterized membrane protein